MDTGSTIGQYSGVATIRTLRQQAGLTRAQAKTGECGEGGGVIRSVRVTSAIMTAVVGVAFCGCMSLASIRASEPTRTAVVKGSAPVIARCIQSELDLSVTDSNPAGTEFALLAPCKVCVQGHFYEISVWQLAVRAGEWDQVRIELRENSTFLFGTGNPWKTVERCVKP
jgi:hypothetical protein